MSTHKKPVAIALGSALAGGLVLSGSAFAVQPLAQGYLLGAQDAAAAASVRKGREGSCGVAVMDTNKDGKVSRAEFDAKHMDGADAAKFDDADANSDGFIDAAEGKALKAGEGKCGEGKCGGNM